MQFKLNIFLFIRFYARQTSEQYTLVSNASYSAEGRPKLSALVARESTTVIVYVSIAAWANLFNRNCSSIIPLPYLINSDSTAGPNWPTL